MRCLPHSVITRERGDIEEQSTRSTRTVSKADLLSQPLASTPCLTPYALVWLGLTRVTESKGMPKSRTFLSKPYNAA